MYPKTTNSNDTYKSLYILKGMQTTIVTPSPLSASMKAHFNNKNHILFILLYTYLYPNRYAIFAIEIHKTAENCTQPKHEM